MGIFFFNFKKRDGTGVGIAWDIGWGRRGL